MPRILIMDDEPLVRAVLRSILERHGYTVMDAPDGRAGLALWRHTPSDLVLTDLFMPECDGIEVIRQLTRVWPQAKIIAMTGGTKIGDFNSTVAPAALQLGAQHMLLKPFTKETLLAVISAMLNSQKDSRTTILDQTHPGSLKRGAMNRRKHVRFPVELRCSFAGDQIAGEGTVLDLSMEGCRVRSDMSVLKGVYLEVFITLLGQIPPLPIDLAVVRWSPGSVFGLEFIRITDRHQARLRRYVQDLEQALMASVPPASAGGHDEPRVSERGRHEAARFDSTGGDEENGVRPL